MTEDLELEIDDWHMMGVRRFNSGGKTYCIAVEIKWDLVATLYRANNWADTPIRMATSFRDFTADPCNDFNTEVKRLHEWTTLGECVFCCQTFVGTRTCTSFCPDDSFPCFPHGPDSGNPTGYNGCAGLSGGSFNIRHVKEWYSYRGFPAQTITWFESFLEQGSGCSGVTEVSQAMSATSSPKIVGTATRKLYNLTDDLLLEEQEYTINRDVRIEYFCNFQKSTCYTGPHMRMNIDLQNAPSGQNDWSIQFPPFASSVVSAPLNNTQYHLFFDTTTGSTGNYTFGETTGRLTLLAPFTSMAVPFGVDFIERPAPAKAFCCDNFSTTDCNGGTLVCTDNPSVDFQRCLVPYGNTGNWQCYRKPTVTLGAA